MFSRHVEGGGRYYITSSPIQGVGVFAARDFDPGEFIEVGIDGVMGRITQGFGNLINHSWAPNSKIVWNSTRWTYDCIANTRISRDTEITINYRNTPWFIKGPDPTWK